MPRFKLQPGTFEHAVHYLIEHKFDLSVFHPKYRNDATGRLAYAPAILLKIILFVYSKGITSCRKMQWSCCYRPKAASRDRQQSGQKRSSSAYETRVDSNRLKIRRLNVQLIGAYDDPPSYAQLRCCHLAIHKKLRPA